VYQFPYHRKGVFKKDQKIIFLNKGGEAGGFLPMKGTAHIINYEWQNFGDLDNFSIGVC
tara:strand:+ start:80 stop:256 length:177 start_codon:yes stop_codon:yes gene_type:complete